MARTYVDETAHHGRTCQDTKSLVKQQQQQQKIHSISVLKNKKQGSQRTFFFFRFFIAGLKREGEIERRKKERNPLGCGPHFQQAQGPGVGLGPGPVRFCQCRAIAVRVKAVPAWAPPAAGPAPHPTVPPRDRSRSPQSTLGWGAVCVARVTVRVSHRGGATRPVYTSTPPLALLSCIWCARVLQWI